MIWQYYISYPTLWGLDFKTTKESVKTIKEKGLVIWIEWRCISNWKTSCYSAHRDTPPDHHWVTKADTKAFCLSHNTKKTNNWPLQMDCKKTEDFCNAIYFFRLKWVLVCFWITVAELLSRNALWASNSAIWPALRNICVFPICRSSQITESSAEHIKPSCNNGFWSTWVKISIICQFSQVKNGLHISFQAPSQMDKYQKEIAGNKWQQL